MADNKQYVLQERERGNVLISEDVIASIAAHAVNEVEGIAGLSVKPGVDIIEMLSKKSWYKGIKITVGTEQELYIDCNVVVAYGQNVVSVSKAAQEAVATAVESFANVKVAAININVCGIVRQ